MAMNGFVEAGDLVPYNGRSCPVMGLSETDALLKTEAAIVRVPLEDLVKQAAFGLFEGRLKFPSLLLSSRAL